MGKDETETSDTDNTEEHVMDLGLLIRKFDVEAWLQSEGVMVSHTGKNLSSNRAWLGMPCPFCIDGDPSEHLGINLETKAVKCWRCGKHSILSLIRTISRTRSRTETENKLTQFQNSALVFSNTKSAEIRGVPKRQPDVLIDFASQNLDSLHIDYLLSRNFDPLEIQRDYRIRGTGPDSYYPYRIIIPFFNGRRLITFTSRDVTGKQNPPYKQCPEDRSIVSPKKWLYNANFNTDTVLVVEGPLDVWRIGGNTVATCGIEYTPEQIILLSKFNRVFILFDAEEQAQNKARELATELGAVVNSVTRLELSSGDPAELTEAEGLSIRKEIFSRIW